MTTLRRAVTVTTVVIVEVLLLIAAPLLIIIAALIAAAVGSTRPIRSTALILAYAAIELATLQRLLCGEQDPDALLRNALNNAYTATRAILDVPLILEAGSATREQLATSNGLVILARHCGPGDSMFIAWLLMVHYQLRLRIVLKSALRLEPTLDLASDHLPMCFVGPHDRHVRDRIRDLAASMSTGDALLLFPEGGNFSWPRWRRAISSLSATGAYDAAAHARQRTYTLPPHPGGVTAALTGSPEADVLLLAHTGFTPDGHDRPWWRPPVHRPLVVHTTFTPAAAVPRDHQTLPAWLDTAWSQVDNWVQSHTTSP
jgi:1-acyl-sn-glycerol-3-phosphate acyltransferase